MPTPISTARPCLATDSAAALDAAVSAARRRSHTQTTSIHVVFALLSSPSLSLLRDALSRARSSSFSPRLQFKALELCFSVALDRLPSSSSSSSAAAVEADEPPVSNSLMAAIKRSQANQRRHPESFHLYQQQQQAAAAENTTPAFAGVKVELQQLVLAILDDPVVSRVFGDAGFRSCDIKLAILRPPPPVLHFPRAPRCPPLFLCNFSAATEGFGIPFPTDRGEENCRRIADVLSRKNGASRNPVLVGVGASETAGDFLRAVEQHNWVWFPLEIRGVRIMSVEGELGGGEKAVISKKLEEVGREAEDPGIVVSIGDLNGLVEGSEEVANCLVSELTKVLELRRGRLWVMGWSATYETYLKFLSLYPLVDKDWNLQLLPITSHRDGVGGLQLKPSSLMDSFVPFGGFFPQAYESLGTLKNPYPLLPRCQHCAEKCEQEVASILKGSSASHEDQQKTVLPSWLKKSDVVCMEGLDISKAKDDKNALNAKIIDLQKKWNEYCQHFHRGSVRVESNNYQALPHHDGISKSIMNSSVTQSQSSFGNAFTVSVSVPTATTVSESISFSLAIEPRHTDLKAIDKLSKSEPPLAGSFHSFQDGHASPSSITSLTTDLVLGAGSNHSCLEGKPAPEGSSQCSTPGKVNESSQRAPSVHIHASSSPSFPKSPGKGSYIQLHTFSCENAACGSISSIEQQGQSSPNLHQKLVVGNQKEFYSSLIEKVGRQEKALWAISEAIICCKTTDKKHHRPVMRGAIWLSFLGPDMVGKKMTAIALAELIFGSRDDLICIDLSCQDSFCKGSFFEQQAAGFRGKTIIDHIAMEIRKKPLSVFFLENVDNADLLAQSSLSKAIQTGKFSDSHGREFSISDSIFVTTAKCLSGKAFAFAPTKENISFSEERIITVKPCQMKIFVSRQESKSRLVPPGSTFISKRKLDSCVKHKEHDECSTSVKRQHRGSGTVLDLNLPAEANLDQNEDCNRSGEDNSTSEDPQDWLEEFLDLADKTVSFEPFDFNALADYVMMEIKRGFSKIIGVNCMLEIDVKVIEQILAATWLMRNKSDLGGWIDKVLCSSLSDLRQRYKLSDCNLVGLVTDQDSFIDEGEHGMILPSIIVLE